MTKQKNDDKNAYGTTYNYRENRKHNADVSEYNL